MPGKYDHVIADLPRIIGEEPAFQQKIDAVKREIVAREPRHASNFALQYAMVRRQKDKLKEELSKLEISLQAYEQLIIEQFENEATKSLTLDDGDNIRTQPEPYLKVEDKELFRQWCVAQGHEREMHLWPSTANAMLKERLLEGEAEMPGTRAYVRTKVVFTRG